MTTDIKEQLRTAAAEIRAEGHDGWGNMADDAIAHIEQLEGQLSAQTAVKTEQPSLSDERIDEIAYSITTPGLVTWWRLFAREIERISAQRQDSNKGSENIAFVGQCHPGCHAKPSASMGICHTMFCPVRDIANGAPK